MKTAISIPEDVFEAAEDLTKRLGVSRSELFAKAVSSFIKCYQNEGVTKKLNEIYGKEDSSMDPALNRLQRQSLTHEKW